MKVTLSKLDKLVKQGKILEAFETYFAEDVVTYDEAGNKTTSKSEKRALLEDFFKEFEKDAEITLFDSFINGDTSYSHFRFIFSRESGEKLQWDEVIIRKWDGKLVTSEFYSNQDYAELKKLQTPKKEAASKTTKATPSRAKVTPKPALDTEKVAAKTGEAGTAKAGKAPSKTAKTAPVKKTAAKKAE